MASLQVGLDQVQIPENRAPGTYIGRLQHAGLPAAGEWRLPADSVDNADFFLRQDSLFAGRSFNYELRNQYWLWVELWREGIFSQADSLQVEVEDAVGKFDRNGIADAEVAALYPEVQAGDYLFLEPNVGRSIFYGAGIPEVRFPNKILIRGGEYETILIDLTSVEGGGPGQRVPIANFLGQVVAQKLFLYGGRFWRLTGQYDPELGVGDAGHLGCDQDDTGVAFGFSRGTYGIWVKNGYANQEIGLTVTGPASGFEIDHLEVSDGGFAGLMVKYENSDQDMTDLELHHLYIHDVGGEGMYLGSVDNSHTQHQFQRVRIYQNVLLRCAAEALQAGRLNGEIEIRNNVLWGGLDWMSPFALHQDHVVQLGVHNGGIDFTDNILLGAGNGFYNVLTRPDSLTVPNGDSVRIERNLNWAARGPMGAYLGAETDRRTVQVWRQNYWGGFDYHYDRVYRARPDEGHILRVAANDITLVAWDNVYDHSREQLYERWSNSTVRIVDLGNHAHPVPAPAFQSLLGGLPPDYLRWQPWSPVIGADPGFVAKNTFKGDTITYLPGDVVTWPYAGDTRYYRCLQAHRGQEPTPEGNQYWEWLRWEHQGKLVPYPPDDVRLVAGDFYQQLGIGLQPLDGPRPDLLLNEDHQSPQGSLRLYPNPARDLVRVELPGPPSQSARVLDVNGRLIGRYQLDAVTIISVDGWSPGAYVLMTDRAAQRFVVQR